CDVIYWPWKGSCRPCLEVVKLRDEVGVVARAVIPRDLVRVQAPLQAATLLPVPRAGRADLGPLVSVPQIKVADVAHVVLCDGPVFAADRHRQRVAVRHVELFGSKEPEPRITSVTGHADGSCI